MQSVSKFDVAARWVATLITIIAVVVLELALGLRGIVSMVLGGAVGFGCWYVFDPLVQRKRKVF